MTTMLDCIKRSSKLAQTIVDEMMERTQPLIDFLGEDIEMVSKIVMVGSGTSNTAALTSKQMVEKLSRIEVVTMLPNEMERKTHYDLSAIYIFTSQSGTSSLVKKAIQTINEHDGYTVALCGDKDSPIAKEARVFIDMGCGEEEYVYRTIGYLTSVVSQMMIGLRVGLEMEQTTMEECREFLIDIDKALSNHSNVMDKTIEWYKKVGDDFKDARSILLYGSQTLHGLALEGALKILETAKSYMSIGYELEDGLHGPNLGFTKDDVIIALSSGDKEDDWMIQGISQFGKNELKQAYIFGTNTIDDNDLSFDIVSEDFYCLEFAPAVQVLAYMLAETAGVEVKDAKHMDVHPSKKYFLTHRG